MPDDDYYKLLGVPRGASDVEIKNAYRSLVKKHHPDRNKGDEAAVNKFKAIQEAYEVLSDKEKRKQYDTYGKVGVVEFVDSVNKQYYKWGEDSTINVEDLDDLFAAFGGGGVGGRGRRRGRGSSMFDQFMGRGQRQPGQRGPGQGPSQARPPRQPKPGKDSQRPVKLTFEQAMSGATVDITLTKRSVSNPKKEHLTVKIPPNVTDGQKIRIRGKGAPGINGGPPGDMYIVCKVQPHPYFKRDGKNVTLTVPVSVTEAMLGAKIDVPTLQGETTITIPPGTRSGAKLRLKGRGTTAKGNQPAGDQHVVIQIVPPAKLTKSQEKAIRALAEELDENPRSDVPWATDSPDRE